MLIVGDGRALTFIEYDVRDVQRWPINDSPLSVLLNPDRISADSHGSSETIAKC